MIFSCDRAAIEKEGRSSFVDLVFESNFFFIFSLGLRWNSSIVSKTYTLFFSPFLVVVRRPGPSEGIKGVLHPPLLLRGTEVGEELARQRERP